MTTPHDDDRDLRERFALLRDEERARAPELARIRARGPRPRRSLAVIALRTVGALATAAALTYAAVALRDAARRRTSPLAALSVAPPPGFGATRWTSPTDFLLDVPGAAMLREVPSFGASPSWPMVDAGDSSRSRRAPAGPDRDAERSHRRRES